LDPRGGQDGCRSNVRLKNSGRWWSGEQLLKEGHRHCRLERSPAVVAGRKKKQV